MELDDFDTENNLFLNIAFGIWRMIMYHLAKFFCIHFNLLTHIMDTPCQRNGKRAAKVGSCVV